MVIVDREDMINPSESEMLPGDWVMLFIKYKKAKFNWFDKSLDIQNKKMNKKFRN